VVEGHSNQYVQQIGDGGPQSVGPDFDTILEMDIRPNSTQKIA
jgi:hypothetical protein